jgi:hypothetical protein
MTRSEGTYRVNRSNAWHAELAELRANQLYDRCESLGELLVQNSEFCIFINFGIDTFLE